MVWGAFSKDGCLPLQRVDGNLNAHRYIDILESNVKPYFEIHPEFHFQQDNAPSHSARSVKSWLQEKGIQVLEWPACSPDLNPIENLWSVLKSQLDLQVSESLDSVFATANCLFCDIDQCILDNVIDSMPRRCAEVIRNKGASIDY